MGERILFERLVADGRVDQRKDSLPGMARGGFVRNKERYADGGRLDRERRVDLIMAL